MHDRCRNIVAKVLNEFPELIDSLANVEGKL
jgi:hypothetical protein